MNATKRKWKQRNLADAFDMTASAIAVAGLNNPVSLVDAVLWDRPEYAIVFCGLFS
jgi:hypothetical protein